MSVIVKKNYVVLNFVVCCFTDLGCFVVWDLMHKHLNNGLFFIMEFLAELCSSIGTSCYFGISRIQISILF